MPVWSTRNLEYGWYSAEREVELSVDGGGFGGGGLLKITVTALLCGQDVLPASLPADPPFQFSCKRRTLVDPGFEIQSTTTSKKSHDILSADPPMTHMADTTSMLND